MFKMFPTTAAICVAAVILPTTPVATGRAAEPAHETQHAASDVKPALLPAPAVPAEIAKTEKPTEVGGLQLKQQVQQLFPAFRGLMFVAMILLAMFTFVGVGAVFFPFRGNKRTRAPTPRYEQVRAELIDVLAEFRRRPADSVPEHVKAWRKHAIAYLLLGQVGPAYWLILRLRAWLNHH
jgi:hypothetical protein